MKHASLILLLAALLSSLSAHPIEPPKKPSPDKLLSIRSSAQAKDLPEGTDSVKVQFTYYMAQDGEFVAIMKELAANPKIKHLRLELPNSTHVKNEHLEVLREFKTLETFDLHDSRDFGGNGILEITAEMPLLKKVDFAFN